LREGVENEHN